MRRWLGQPKKLEAALQRDFAKLQFLVWVYLSEGSSLLPDSRAFRGSQEKAQ